MAKDKKCEALENDFTSTFISELMPGILHNFANPLNGIMGRSKLLQRRMDTAFKKINDQYPETAAALQDEIQRIKNDIRAVNNETESFFEIFRDATAKFYALATKGVERINLSNMLEAEIRFANFYLEFKHEITKKIEFDKNIPDINGGTAELSLVFWRIIRYAMSTALKSEKKDFILTTEHDDENAVVLIRYSGQAMEHDNMTIILNYFKDKADNLGGVKLEQGVILALEILKKYSAQVQFSTENNLNVITVTIPCRFSSG